MDRGIFVKLRYVVVLQALLIGGLIGVLLALVHQFLQ